MLGCLDALRRFLLKGMYYPQIKSELHGVNDAKRIASMGQCNFKDSGPQTLQRLNDVGLPALRCNRQGRQADDLSFLGKPVEILAGSLDPRDGPGLPGHFLRTLMLSNMTTSVNLVWHRTKGRYGLQARKSGCSVRITQEPAVMGGKACIRGLRVTVGMIVGQIAAGQSIDTLLSDYPYLEREDIMQALRYAAWRSEEREVTLATA
jgi:uncharacterized protein (DUF433 family)